MFDVAVVGGSVAGAATAIHMAEMGHRVAILERNAVYRRKACGEGLFPAGVAELERLGLGDFAAGAGSPIEGVRFHAGGNVAEAPLGACGGLGIQRSLLDGELLARAKTFGCEVHTGVAVARVPVEGRRAAGVELADGERVAARVVIGADGLHSRMRRLVGLDSPSRGNRYGVSGHVRVRQAMEPVVDVYFERAYELYITPVGERVANVAVLTRKDGMRRFAGDLAGGFAALVGGHRAFADGMEMVDAPRAAGPFAVRARRPWRANVALVGDAAGFLDGISGEGMSVALVSARMCAAAANDYLASGTFEGFRRYERERASLVRNSNLLARVSLALGSRPGLAAYAVRNLARQPDTFARLTAISSGDAGLMTLRPRDVAALMVGL